MGRARKVKGNKRTRVIGEEDRISTLPDSILHQILCPLNTADAVRTCVLSSRWRYVWKSLPNLNLEDDHPSTLQIRDFNKFVYKIISLRDKSACISSFRLYSPYPLSHHTVDQCIRYAVEHNVEELYLNAFDGFYKLPSFLFTCKSLTKLQLSNVNGICPPQALGLPYLKVLHLKLFVFWDDNYSWRYLTQMHREMSDMVFLYSREDGTWGWNSQERYVTSEIFSSCPKLECLTLECCWFRNLNVSVPQLRSFEILMGGDVIPFLSVPLFEIDAPKLTSFKFKGPISPVCSMSNLPCLEDVVIDLHPHENGAMRKTQQDLLKLFEHLGNASFLKLSPETIKVLVVDPGSLKNCHPPFPCLKNLKILAQKDTALSLISPSVVAYLMKGSYGYTAV